MLNQKILVALVLLAPLFSVCAKADGNAFAEEDALKKLESTPKTETKAPQIKFEEPLHSGDMPPMEERLAPPEENKVNLILSPAEAQDQYNEDTRLAWYKRFPYGLMRGFCNLATCPGEMGRAVSYCVSEYHWALWVPTSLVGAIAGTLTRAGAGCADVLTLGLMGDRKLASGFPSYVWEGQWDFSKPAPAAERPPEVISRPLNESTNTIRKSGEPYVPAPTEKTPLRGVRKL